MKFNSSRSMIASFVTILLVTSILAPAFIHPASAPASPFDPWTNGWLYRKQITIHSSLIPDTTPTYDHFPVLVKITGDGDLIARAVDANDIMFMADTGSANQLDHEIEQFTKSSGNLVAWVRIPSLSSTTDTTFYMYYGKSGASNSQNPAGVWPNTPYAMVQHLSETSGTVLDSTSNNNDGTPTNLAGQGVAGKIAGADSFDGITHSGYVSIPDSTSLNFGTNSFSCMFWFNSVTTGTQDMVSKKTGAASDTTAGYKAIVSTASATGFSIAVGDGATAPTPDFVRVDTGTEASWGTGVWTMFTMVVDRSQQKAFLYINNARKEKAPVVNDLTNIASTSNSLNLLLGACPNSPIDRFFIGMLDEVRIQSGALSSDWITTSYNSMNDPSSFLSAGSQETIQRTLTVNIVGTGTVTKDPSKATYDHGETVQLQANPALGWSFSAWTGDLTGTDNPKSIIMDGDKTVTATFTTVVVTLNSITPQYYKRGGTVSYSGTVTLDGSPVPDGTDVGIIIRDHLGAQMHLDNPVTTGGAFSGSFIIGPLGAEGLCTIYASSGDGTDSKTFNLDASTPTSSVTNPAQGSTITSVTTIGGTASDTGGSGLASVAITIKRSDNQYWTGLTWGALTWLPASGTTSWTYDPTGVSWTSDSYTIVSKATDVAGNVQTPGAGNTFTLDMNEYTLTVTVSPVGSGTVTKTPDQATYHYDDVVQLQANPGAGYSFSGWSGGLSGNPTSVTIQADTSVTATFTLNVPTVTVTGAYHGARLIWNNVGALSYNIYYSTSSDVNTATQFTTGLTGTTCDVKNLPSSTWGSTCWFWVAPVTSGGEAPKTSWGAGQTTPPDKIWAYKIEITTVTVDPPPVAGDIKVVVGFRSRYLETEGFEVKWQLGEFLGPGTESSVPNRPIAITSMGPVTLSSFLSTGGFSFQTSGNGEIQSGSSYKAWIFLWNQYPSDPGYWESFASKYEKIPITIP